MRWLFFFLLILALPVGGRPPRVRLVCWNLAAPPAAEPWEQEDVLQRAARSLAPLKAEVAVLVNAPQPERLAAAGGFTALLTAPGVAVLSRLPLRGYRTFGPALEVHFDQPFPFAVLAARAETAEESWRVATRGWELRTSYPGRGVAVLGELGPPDARWWEGMRAPVGGILLDPLLLRRLQPKSVKSRLLKRVSPHPLTRLELK